MGLSLAVKIVPANKGLKTKKKYTVWEISKAHMKQVAAKGDFEGSIRCLHGKECFSVRRNNLNKDTETYK